MYVETQKIPFCIRDSIMSRFRHVKHDYTLTQWPGLHSGEYGWRNEAAIPRPALSVRHTFALNIPIK